MPQTNYTPIQLYRSSTAGAVPLSGSLQPGELAINIQDGKLFFKNAAGTVATIADSAVISSGLVTLTGAQTLTNKTIDGQIITGGYTEQVYAISGTTPALSPTNGSIQTWTLTGNSTPTAGTWAEGQSLTLMVDDGSAYTINWSSMSVSWKTNSGISPPLNTSGYTVIQFWKVGATIYGARVGDA